MRKILFLLPIGLFSVCYNAFGAATEISVKNNLADMCVTVTAPNIGRSITLYPNDSAKITVPSILLSMSYQKYESSNKCSTHALGHGNITTLSTDKEGTIAVASYGSSFVMSGTLKAVNNSQDYSVSNAYQVFNYNGYSSITAEINKQE